jgi:TRAP-type C4-dicarboxylate transport system permease small subunit
MSLINLVLAVDEVDISGLERDTAAKLNMKSFTDLSSLFSQDLLNLVFVLVGLLFFASLVMAGWEYMMSSGDPKKVASATTRFMNSLIGLIIAFTAYLVVRIITNFLGLGNVV